MSVAGVSVGRTRVAAKTAIWRRNYPIAVHLGMFAAGILIPVLVIVAFMLISTARMWREDLLHDARLIAHHIDATIEVELEKSIAVGQTLATALLLNGEDPARFRAEAREVSDRLGVNITVRDLSGRQIINTFIPPGVPLPVSSESMLAVDRLAAARKGLVISDLRVATLRNVPVVNVVFPVLRGSEVTGFISTSIAPDKIASILSSGLPDGWIAGVVGRDGRLIARSVDQDRYLGTVNPGFLKSATDPEGIWSGPAREGYPLSGVYLRSALTGWTVSVAVPEAMLQAPVRSAMLWLGGLVAASLAASLYFGWRLSRRISAPIGELAFRARELGAGRQPGAVHCSVDEVNAVSDALLAASAELDRRASAAAAAIEAVRENEERLQLVQDTAGIGTVDLDIVRDRAVCSPRYYEMFSLPPDMVPHSTEFLGRIHPEDLERLTHSRETFFRRGGPFEDEFRIMTPAGEERWIYTRGRVDMKDGRPARLIGASIDITDRKRSEEHLRFLLRELSHRSKNLLAVIQAMAGQTAKSVESVEDFKRRFGERLMGMAKSHDLLVNQDWLGVSVENLVRGQLASFTDGRDARLRIHGPDVDLKSDAAEALGLALHELATNSMKYGALNDSGDVEISWEVSEPTGHADGRRFRMDWIERTASPISPPNHKGFGRMVIEHTVQATLRGKVTLTFPPDGVRWHLDAPATCLTPSN